MGANLVISFLLQGQVLIELGADNFLGFSVSPIENYRGNICIFHCCQMMAHFFTRWLILYSLCSYLLISPLIHSFPQSHSVSPLSYFSLTHSFLHSLTHHSFPTHTHRHLPAHTLLHLLTNFLIQLLSLDISLLLHTFISSFFHSRTFSHHSPTLCSLIQ